MVKEICNLSKNKSRIFVVKKKAYRRKWKREENNIKKQLNFHSKKRDLKKISKNLGNKTQFYSYSRLHQVQPVRTYGTWKKEEDEKLLKLFEKYPKNWSKISKEFETRSPKQIRDRYINVLDSSINRAPFTENEDKRILQYQQIFGNRWSKISGLLGTNRTTDMVKNRFYCLKRRKPLYQFRTTKEEESLKELDTFKDLTISEDSSNSDDLVYSDDLDNSNKPVKIHVIKGPYYYAKEPEYLSKQDCLNEPNCLSKPDCLDEENNLYEQDYLYDKSCLNSSDCLDDLNNSCNSNCISELKSLFGFEGISSLLNVIHNDFEPTAEDDLYADSTKNTEASSSSEFSDS